MVNATGTISESFLHADDVSCKRVATLGVTSSGDDRPLYIGWRILLGVTVTVAIAIAVAGTKPRNLNPVDDRFEDRDPRRNEPPAGAIDQRKAAYLVTDDQDCAIDPAAETESVGHGENRRCIEDDHIEHLTVTRQDLTDALFAEQPAGVLPRRAGWQQMETTVS